jgi:hypothetical protein
MKAQMGHHGGKHGWDITVSQAHEAAYWLNSAAILYGVMIGVVKISILLLYRRVFSPIRRSVFDITIITLIGIIFAFYGSTTFIKIFQCTPREKIWNPTVHGRCFNIFNILNASGAFNFTTDIIILLLPMHAVRKLQIDRLKKILIVVALTFGL